MKLELVTGYHLARVALDNPTRHERMVWSVNEYILANAVQLVEAGTTRAQVYKAMCEVLS